MGRAEVAARDQAVRREGPLHRPRSRRTCGCPDRARGGRHDGAEPPCGGLLGLGLEDLGKRLQVGLEGSLGCCCLMTVPPEVGLRYGVLSSVDTHVFEEDSSEKAAGRPRVSTGSSDATA